MPAVPSGSLSPPATSPAPARFVAVHDDVISTFQEWLEEDRLLTVVAKMLALVDTLIKGSEAEIKMMLNANHYKAISSASGVGEIGPNKRGGAPRLFLKRTENRWFFLIAGLEKTQTGAAEIPTAKARAGELPKPSDRLTLTSDASSPSDHPRLRGFDHYQIFTSTSELRTYLCPTRS